MPRIHALFAFVLFSLLMPLHAEDAPKSNGLAGIWITGGHGFPLSGTSADYHAIAAATGTDMVFVVRLAESRQHDVSMSPDIKVQEWGFLAGEIKRPSRQILLYAGLGAGSARVTTRGKFLGYKRDTAGAPVELEFDSKHSSNFAVLYEAHVLYAPIRYAALGVSFFGDFNSAKSLTAATLNLHLGYLPLTK